MTYDADQRVVALKTGLPIFSPKVQEELAALIAVEQELIRSGEVISFGIIRYFRDDATSASAGGVYKPHAMAGAALELVDLVKVKREAP